MTTENQTARPPRTERRRLSINITPVERAGRVILGAAAIIAAILLLTGAGGLTSATFAKSWKGSLAGQSF